MEAWISARGATRPGRLEQRLFHFGAVGDRVHHHVDALGNVGFDLVGDRGEGDAAEGTLEAGEPADVKLRSVILEAAVLSESNWPLGSFSLAWLSPVANAKAIFVRSAGARGRPAPARCEGATTCAGRPGPAPGGSSLTEASASAGGRCRGRGGGVRGGGQQRGRQDQPGGGPHRDTLLHRHQADV